MLGLAQVSRVPWGDASLPKTSPEHQGPTDRRRESSFSPTENFPPEPSKASGLPRRTPGGRQNPGRAGTASHLRDLRLPAAPSLLPGRVRADKGTQIHLPSSFYGEKKNSTAGSFVPAQEEGHPSEKAASAGNWLLLATRPARLPQTFASS